MEWQLCYFVPLFLLRDDSKNTTDTALLLSHSRSYARTISIPFLFEGA